MYNETCLDCGSTGNEYLINGLCFSCAETKISEHFDLQQENERLLKILDKLSRLGNEPHLGNSDGNRIAQQAIKKEKDYLPAKES